MTKDKNELVKPNEDQKQNPVSLEGEKDIAISKKQFSKFIDKLDKDIKCDITSDSTHQNSLAHWYDRRFGILDKDPQFPWVGSSNVTMPLIDMEVTKAKAPLMGTLEVSPIVSFKPLNAKGFQTSSAAEGTMEWLLTTKMKDFKSNVEIVADNMGTYGYGIIKTIYDYQTDVVTEVIRREELSQDDLAQIAQFIAAVQEGIPFEDGSIPTQEDLEIALTDLISARFGLNVEDQIDQKAIEDIMNFILKEQDSVTINRVAIVYDAPRCVAIDPSKFYIEEGAMSIQTSERLTEVFSDTINEMRKKAQTGWYDAEAVKKIIDRLAEDDNAKGDSGKGKSFAQLDNEKREREGGTTTSKQGIITMHESYCLYDIDGDGVKERCLLIYNPDTNIQVRFMEFPYEHGEWPYTQLRNEETDGRFHSPRGIAEILDNIDDIITQNHRAKLNALAIGNAPTFKYKIGSNLNPNNMQWIPGQFYPVMNMNDFEQVNVNVKDFSFDNEETNLRFWAEGLLGSASFVFEQQKSEARTAQEVSAIQGNQQSAQSLKVSRFQREMKQVYRQIWALWNQYGPNMFTVMTSNGELKQLSKWEINGEFDLVPVGTAGNANPELEFVRAQQRFNSLIGLEAQGLLPLLGDEYEINFGAAFKDMMDKDDKVASNTIIRRRSPEEIAQIQQQKAQQAAAQQQQAAQEQAVNDNAPVPLNELQATLKQMEKKAPNGGAQQVAL